MTSFGEKKSHYLKKEVIWNTKQGGLEVLDYNTLNDTFKIKWLIDFLKNRESLWNIF